MPDHRRHLGDFGEQVAATYLEQHGYQILARKWRCAQGEIDLIARDGTTLVFTEVRTRSTTSAAESITSIKRQRMRSLAYAYGATPETDWRIDAILIELDRAGVVRRIEHLVHVVEE